MNKNILYIYSLVAYRADTRNVSHVVGFCFATSLDDATELAYSDAVQRFPFDDGYIRYSVSMSTNTNDLISQILAGVK